MKHIDYFNNFLRRSVNLPKYKLDLLGQRVDSIYCALKGDKDLGPLIKRKIPQGSWAQRTIINPQNGKPFDADFMVEMVENPDWADDLKKYGDAIYRVLDRTSPYNRMPHGRKCRCVYVSYSENEMHVDIVPFVVRDDETQWIINRDANKWERTDTRGFTKWMREKDAIAGNHLREVIRIMKFLRDHKNSFTGTKSILLTAMLGEQVAGSHKIPDPGYYADLPTALLHIVSDLDRWLQNNPEKPTIMDPSGSGTSFDHRWSQETYKYFRDRIHAHAAEIKDAYHEADFDKSVKKWQRLFGDGFTAPPPSASSRKYSMAGRVVRGVGAAGVASVNFSGRAG